MEHGHSGSWPTTTARHPSLPSSSSPQGGLSNQYSAYPNYGSTLATPYSHLIYPTGHFHSHGVQHHSASSYDPTGCSDVAPRYTLPGYSRSASPTARHQLDAESEYPSSLVPSQYPSPGSLPAISVGSEGYPSPSAASGYTSDVPNTTWSKHDFPSLEPHSYYADIAASLPPAMPDPRSTQTTRAPKRQTRKLTSKEDANFQCEIPGCGKLFSRSYNYKAHMATHNENRAYPFLCPEPDCDKKFVRKTDLQRHNQSVHTKERSHRCDYCLRMFARKDTLRRHMDDGCSRRFNIETVDMDRASYATYEANKHEVQQSVEDARLPPALHHYPPSIGMMPTSAASLFPHHPHTYPDR